MGAVPIERRRQARVLGGVIAAAVFAAACELGTEVVRGVGDLTTDNPVYENSLAILLQRPCDEKILVASEDTTAVYIRLLTNSASFESEVHDCQRLIDPVTKEFGALIGIFPDSVAMSLAALADTTVSVATVFSWGRPGDGEPEGYAPLAIPDDFRWGCLWIDKSEGKAGIGPAPADGLGCRYGVGNPPVDLPLVVDVAPVPASDLKPTGRWRWHEPSWKTYIGIKCGTDWCSIKLDDLLPTTASETFAGVTRYAGDFDEQRLAVELGDGQLVPGPLARIIPKLALKTYTALDFAGEPEVADIELVDTIPADAALVAIYVAKFNLGAPDAEGIRRATLSILLSTSGSLGRLLHAASTPTEGARKLELQTNESHAAIGSSRWRWLDDDEAMWISCGHGCCTIRDDPPE